MIEKFQYVSPVTLLKYIVFQPSLLKTLFEKKISTHSVIKIITRLFQDNPEIFTEKTANFLNYPQYLTDHLTKHHQRISYLGFFLYALTRLKRPDIVVETGVCNGYTTLFTLTALKENQHGTLISIDLPPDEISIEKSEEESEYQLHTLSDGQGHWVNREFKIGALVPAQLKDRWKLIKGDAKIELPKILSEHTAIDMFFHDSLHTYEHMSFEYKAAWKALNPGGLLLSHDILWNDAFRDFCAQNKDCNRAMYKNLGIIKK